MPLSDCDLLSAEPVAKNALEGVNNAPVSGAPFFNYGQIVGSCLTGANIVTCSSNARLRSAGICSFRDHDLSVTPNA